MRLQDHGSLQAAVRSVHFASAWGLKWSGSASRLKLHAGLSTQISSEISSVLKNPKNIWMNIPIVVHPALSLARIAGFLSLMPALCTLDTVNYFYVSDDVVSLLRGCLESHFLGTKSET